MSINYPDVAGDTACQPATETLPALYRKMSLEVWKNIIQSWSQTFPGLSVAHNGMPVAPGIAAPAAPARTGATE